MIDDESACESLDDVDFVPGDRPLQDAAIDDGQCQQRQHVEECGAMAAFPQRIESHLILEPIDSECG